MQNNRKIQYYHQRITTILNGEPWFGRPVFSILPEIHPALVYIKPNKNENAHSLIDLLYHIITWTDFCLLALKGEEAGNEWEETNNWRIIDPKIHTWATGTEEFRNACNSLLQQLEKMNDAALEATVPNKNYNTEFLLNGWIDHTIYHLGQIAYVKKWLVGH